MIGYMFSAKGMDGNAGRVNGRYSEPESESR